MNGIKTYKEKLIKTGLIISDRFTLVLVSSNSGIKGFLTKTIKKIDKISINMIEDFIRIFFLLFMYWNILLFESIEVIKIDMAGIAMS